MQLAEIYNNLKKSLSELEARYLIEAVTGLESADFIARPDKELPQEQIDQINAYTARRLKGEPLSKILGVKEFWGIEFIVNKHVLDPRPDTETLIEAVLDWVKSNSVIARSEVTKQSHEGERLPRSLHSLAMTKNFKILDLGTGTGCIPISLLSELSHATAVAVDISDEALNIARQNAEKHKMSDRIEFRKGDWLEGLEGESFDIITSNPPYIPESDIENLSVEVKNHDPIMALSGGKDGLDDYKKIIFSLKNKLNGKNRAFLEIGFGQLESLTRLVDESNLLLCDSRADIAGIPRVVEISCGDK